MTRKDYVLIAAALRDTLLIDCPTQEYLMGAKAAARSAAFRIADALGRDNPRFDRERFLTACGVQS
jgi:hypothetical protein